MCREGKGDRMVATMWMKLENVPPSMVDAAKSALQAALLQLVKDGDALYIQSGAHPKDGMRISTEERLDGFAPNGTARHAMGVGVLLTGIERVFATGGTVEVLAAAP